MRLVSKSFFINLEETVQVGELKANLVAQVMGTKQDFDIEFADITGITYMGVPIEGYDNWRKFKNFHEEMGVEYGRLLDEKFEEIFTKEAIQKIITPVKF